MEEDRSPGWDMRAITTIAKKRFGGLKPMFHELGWEWTGAGWLATANSRIVKEYGSIAEFRLRLNEKADVEQDGQ